MNQSSLRSALLRTKSKESIHQLSIQIGNNSERFEWLMDLYLNDEWRVNQKAVWVITTITEKYPRMISPYIPHLLEALKKPKASNAVKRNTTKIFELIDIPNEWEGQIFDQCFSYLEDINEAIAVRVFSMQVVYDIAQKEPELLREIAAVIEEHLPYSSAGFRARGKKILALIKKGS